MLGENHGKETSWYNQWSFDCCCTWYQLVHANPKRPEPHFITWTLIYYTGETVRVF